MKTAVVAYKKRNIQKTPGKPSQQGEGARSWIFAALMLLMDDKPYSKITVSDITEKAGIARQTFYYSYKDKDEVAFEYIHSVINSELLNIEKMKKDDKQNSIVLVLDHKYMMKHQKILKKIMSIPDIENRIIRDGRKLPEDLLKQFSENLTPEEKLIFRYKINYQITGSLSMLFDWFMNDMPMPIESVVSMINAMNMPKTVQFRNIPGITFRLKGGA